MDNPQNPVCKDCETQEFSLLDGLDISDLTLLKEKTILRDYKRGDVIFSAGNQPLGLYMIHRGQVKIVTTGLTGKEQIIRLHGPKDLIGYQALVSQENYNTTASVIEDGTLYFIDTKFFKDLTQKYPHLYEFIVKQICYDLTRAEQFLRSMAQKPVKQRLAHILLIIQKKFALDPRDPHILNTTLTREEFANYVGTATETIIRLLSEYKDSALIETKGRKIRILNEEGLRTLASLD